MSPRKDHAYNVANVDPDSFGAQLRRLREDAGLSQEELAAKIGTKQQRISSFERNAITPREPNIIELADALNVPPALLFEASRFRGVLPLGPERRERLLRLRERDWKLLDQTIAVIGEVTPEERDRLEEGLRDFFASCRTQPKSS